MMPFEQDILATHPDRCPVDDEPMAEAAHAAATELHRWLRNPFFNCQVSTKDLLRWLILQAKDPAHIIVRIPGTEGLLPTSNP